MGKDMIYYRIMDFTKNECCPICSLVNYQTKQAMDGFLYENVNDPLSGKNYQNRAGCVTTTTTCCVEWATRLRTQLSIPI